MLSGQLAAGPESTGGTDLLELLDDVLVLVQEWLVGRVHAWQQHTEGQTLKMCCLLENTSGGGGGWGWGWGLPGLESSVFRFFSFLTFICLAISPEERRETSRLDTERH